MDLRLANHCRRNAGQQLGGVRLVEKDRPRGPAIRKGEPVEIVENPSRRRGRKAVDRQDAQMGGAEPRLEAAGQRLIGEKRIEVAVTALLGDAGFRASQLGSLAATHCHFD